MRLALVGKLIERALDRCFVGDLRSRAKRAEPRRALAIVGEQAMHVSAGDEAVLRGRPVDAPIGEAQKRPGAIRAPCLADMHLVAAKGRAVGDALALDLTKGLFASQHGLDVEQAKALGFARRSLDPVTVGDPVGLVGPYPAAIVINGQALDLVRVS